MSFALILSLTWWKDAGRRAGRTALVTLLPFVLGLGAADDPQQLALSALSTVALAVVLSLAWSLRSLPEADETKPRPWWAATLDRVVRTFGQVLFASIPAVTLIEQVEWTAVLVQAATAAAGSFILALVSVLPETEPIKVPAADVIARYGADGKIYTGDASGPITGASVRELTVELATEVGPGVTEPPRLRVGHATTTLDDGDDPRHRL